MDGNRDENGTGFRLQMTWESRGSDVTSRSRTSESFASLFPVNVEQVEHSVTLFEVGFCREKVLGFVREFCHENGERWDFKPILSRF